MRRWLARLGVFLCGYLSNSQAGTLRDPWETMLCHPLVQQHLFGPLKHISNHNAHGFEPLTEWVPLWLVLTHIVNGFCFGGHTGTIVLEEWRWDTFSTLKLLSYNSSPTCWLIFTIQCDGNFPWMMLWLVNGRPFLVRQVTRNVQSLDPVPKLGFLCFIFLHSKCF